MRRTIIDTWEMPPGVGVNLACVRSIRIILIRMSNVHSPVIPLLSQVDQFPHSIQFNQSTLLNVQLSTTFISSVLLCPLFLDSRVLSLCHHSLINLASRRHQSGHPFFNVPYCVITYLMPNDQLFFFLLPFPLSYPFFVLINPLFYPSQSIQCISRTNARTRCLISFNRLSSCSFPHPVKPNAAPYAPPLRPNSEGNHHVLGECTMIYDLVERVTATVRRECQVATKKRRRWPQIR